MAEISFVLYDTEEKPYEAEEIVSYELMRDVTAPCDGLRLCFYSGAPLNEINRVRAFRKDALIFSGFVDAQREACDENGFRVFVYARSSACLLVDNEAQPGEYFSPTAKSMFLLNAQALGFKLAMPDCSAGGDYTVSKGVSCYGSINALVNSATGKSIIVTPTDEITLPSGGAYKFAADTVISEKRCINRGGALSAIDFKRGDAEGYCCRTESLALSAKGIKRSKKLNLSALPEGQRAATLKRELAASARDYNAFQLAVCGAGGGELYDRAEYTSAVFGRLEDYYIASIHASFDKNGEKTVYTLWKENELREITYVD